MATWPRLYYLLAVFDLVAVAGGLYLTHRLTNMFAESVGVNKAWQRRMQTYSELRRHSAEIDAAGNDALADGNTTVQERRIDRALLAFTSARDIGRQQALESLTGPIQATILADLVQVDEANQRMVAEARQILGAIRRQDQDAAARHMAAMDHDYADVNGGVVKLRDDGLANAALLFDEQEHAARSLTGHQLFLAGTMLVMVTAATFYGFTLSRRVQADAAEREDTLDKLRESEATLKASDRALRKTQERFELATLATNDALWDWEIATDSVWWNAGFPGLFGHATPGSTMAFWRNLIHPDDGERIDRSLEQFLGSAGMVWTDEYRFRRSDGTYAWVLDRGYVVRESDGAPRRMIHSMMDITDRKEAERLKSDFVSFVSHQLRTPLSGMNWLLELAADIDDLPGAAREYITDARASAQRLVTLVNDLLDIARLESGRTVAQPEPVALEELTRSVLSELQTLVAHRAHAIEVRSSPAAPVWADRQLIRQVVMNLLSNAIKYTPAGGRISISCRQENGTVQWGVQDNGVGVPRAAQARLFERFFRADNATAMEVEGTGLGLHLVRLIVEQAGGRVWCESEEGRGAMFAFTWPAHGGSVS
jgi:PAS domain S-box-containing protein